MTYKIVMTNGDEAEAESLAGLLIAARTLNEDADHHSFPKVVTISDRRSGWATNAARVYVAEALPQAAGRTS